MTYWLDRLDRLVSAETRREGPPGDRGHIALVLGDAAARATGRVLDHGWEVVRALPPLGTAARWHATEPVTARITVGGGWFPFDCDTFDLVILHETLEYVVDDRRTVEEAVRVLRPGGRLLARLPAAGRLGWCDSLNIYRYVHETTGRGSVPPETSQIGFRRRFGSRDIDQLFAGVPLGAVRRERSGNPLPEAANLAAMLATRWVSNDPGATQRARLAYARWGDASERLPGVAWWTVSARKDGGPWEPAPGAS